MPLDTSRIPLLDQLMELAQLCPPDSLERRKIVAAAAELAVKYCFPAITYSPLAKTRDPSEVLP